MPASVQVSFLDMEWSEALVAEIQGKMERLNDLFPQITACEVFVEGPHHRHRQGNLYRIRIHMSVPDRELFAGQEPHDKHQQEDPVVAVSDAFDAIRRQLIDYLKEHRIETAVDAGIPHGTVIKICLPDGPDFPERGFGLISTCDGREVYFHADSLIDVDFRRLELGSEVLFAADQREDGMHASSVWLAGQQQQLHSVP